MGFPRDYARAMEKRFGYQVVWPPNSRLRLGDFGVVKQSKQSGPAFERLGNVADRFGIGFTERRGAMSEVETLQSDGVSIVEVAASGAMDGVEVALKVSFERKNTMIYSSAQMVPLEVEDKLQLGLDLAARLARGDWKSHWVVVTDLHETQGLIVLLSQAAGASVTPGGNSSLTPGNLASVAAEPRVVAQSSSIARYMSGEPTTPLLKARVVRSTGLSMALHQDPSEHLMHPRTDEIDPVGTKMAFQGVSFDYCDLDRVGGD